MAGRAARATCSIATPATRHRRRRTRAASARPATRRIAAPKPRRCPITTTPTSAARPATIRTIPGPAVFWLRHRRLCVQAAIRNACRSSAQATTRANGAQTIVCAPEWAHQARVSRARRPWTGAWSATRRTPTAPRGDFGSAAAKSPTRTPFAFAVMRMLLGTRNRRLPRSTHAASPHRRSARDCRCRRVWAALH